jgi:hypothetical protein
MKRRCSSSPQAHLLHVELPGEDRLRPDEGDGEFLQGLTERLQARPDHGNVGIHSTLGQLVETGEARLGGEADSAGGRAPGDAVVGEAHLPRAGETTVVPRLPPPMRRASEIE